MRRYLVLGIDPSINTTGYGLLEWCCETSSNTFDGPILVASGTWKTKYPKLDLPSRMATLDPVLDEWMSTVGWGGDVSLCEIVIEMSDWWKPGRKNIKELMKLCYATGWLGAKLQGLLADKVSSSPKVIEVPVSSWKGRTSKAETAAMVDALFGRKLGKMSNHASDAIGLALWHESQLRFEKAVM